MRPLEGIAQEGDKAIGWYLGDSLSAASVFQFKDGMHLVLDAKAWRSSDADPDTVVGMAVHHDIPLTREDILQTQKEKR